MKKESCGNRNGRRGVIRRKRPVSASREYEVANPRVVGADAVDKQENELVDAKAQEE